MPRPRTDDREIAAGVGAQHRRTQGRLADAEPPRLGGVVVYASSRPSSPRSGRIGLAAA